MHLRNKAGFYLKTALIALIWGTQGCGLNIGTTSPNDPRPTGTLLAQGQFASQNGKSVSGSALVFSQSGTSYIVRLEGISTPSESGLYVRVYTANSGQVSNLSLTATSGSQNYYFTSTETSPTFKSVYIFSVPSNIAYGLAVLQ